MWCNTGGVVKAVLVASGREPTSRSATPPPDPDPDSSLPNRQSGRTRDLPTVQVGPRNFAGPAPRAELAEFLIEKVPGGRIRKNVTVALVAPDRGKETPRLGHTLHRYR